jgi:hypothetical protein
LKPLSAAGGLACLVAIAKNKSELQADSVKDREVMAVMLFRLGAASVKSDAENVF